ncbi:MAG: hypothetical protein ACLQFR_15070 [Streptosporangiaceae bacterium]
MRAPVLRRLALATAVAGLIAVGLPAAQASAHVLAASTLGHACLVGTWRDNGGLTSTQWDGHTVAMRGGAGNLDHISASGKDHDFWGSKAKPYYGKYLGHTLKEVIRGRNTITISGKASSDKLRLTEDGWSRGSTNTYTYEGHTYSGYLNQHGTFTQYFRCTADKLTWRSTKRITDTESRISRKP